MKKVFFIFTVIFFCLALSGFADTDAKINEYEASISHEEFIESADYSNKIRKEIQKKVEEGNTEDAILRLLHIVKNPVYFKGRNDAYIDLVYLLSIEGNYNVSNHIISDYKSKFTNIDPEVLEWLNFIEIFNISQTATKEYDLVNLINNFLNDNPESIFTEHILYLKAKHLLNQNNTDYAIKTYEIIYNVNPQTIYFNDLYPLLKFFYDNTEQYDLSKEIIMKFIKNADKNVILDDEYFWLGQYYDSLNDLKTAKKYFVKLANNTESALYPEALYWLGNYYKNRSDKKANEYYNKLSQFEGYEHISAK
jgi:tetratricopeptide (TPR) repeat protein